MMTAHEIVKAQIAHQETKIVPYRMLFDPQVETWLTSYYGDESWRQRLRPFLKPCCSFKTLIDNPVTLEEEPLEDGLTRDMLGTIWRIDRWPRHLERPAIQAPSLDGYNLPSADNFMDPGMRGQAMTWLQEFPDIYPYIDTHFGLWEFVWNIRGFENELMDCVAEPDFLSELLDRLTDMVLEQIEYCREIPAEAFKFSDDWGDQRGVMIGPELWRKFLKPRYARIYDAVHAQGKVVLSHCCGSVADIMPDLVEIGLDVLESVQPEACGMNPYELKKEWGDRITFWGGLGSQSTIPFGTPDTIRAEINKLRSTMSNGGGYILAPAKRLLTDTPIENVVAVFESFASG
jgi:uroporphyrinogen decarboxylase